MIEEPWYEAYCTSAYVIGWSAVEDAGPVPDVIPVLRTADEFLDEHGLLDIIREQAEQDALWSLIHRRRVKAEQHYKTQLVTLINRMVPTERVAAVATADRDQTRARIRAILDQSPYLTDLKILIKTALKAGAIQGRKDGETLLHKTHEQDPGDDDWEPDDEDVTSTQQGVLAGLSYSLALKLAAGVAAGMVISGLIGVAGDTADNNAGLLVLGDAFAGAANDGTAAAYDTADVVMYEMLLAPDACEICVDLAAEGPWTADEVPNRPGDTHDNCRCGLAPTT